MLQKRTKKVKYFNGKSKPIGESERSETHLLSISPVMAEI